MSYHVLPIKLSVKKPDDISDWGTDIYAYREKNSNCFSVGNITVYNTQYIINSI